MSASPGIAPGRNPIWALTFLSQIHRYRTLLAKFWWIMLLTVSLAVCAAAWLQIQKPPTYVSSGTFSVNVDNPTLTVGQTGTSSYSQGLDDMLANQILVLKTSNQIRQMTADNLLARYPDMPPAPVSVSYLPQSSFLTISAAGTNPVYTQRYLQALLDAYATYRKQQRNDVSGQQLEKIKTEILRMEDVLKKDDQQLIDYQQEKKMVFHAGVNPDSTLADLKKKLAEVQEHLNMLNLMTPEQGLDQGQVARKVAAADSADNPNQQQAVIDAANAEAEYHTTRAQIATLQAQKDDLSRDLRPKHPKIVVLTSQINTLQQGISNLLSDSRKRLDYLRTVDKSKVAQTEQQIRDAEAGKFDYDIQQVGFNSLMDQKHRDENTYDSLKKTLTDGSLGKDTNLDPMKLSENASPAVLLPVSWVKSLGLALAVGLGLGTGILLMLEQMDDRMTSVSAFQSAFSEQVIGQIPRDESIDAAEMLRPDDQRHQLVESFRNLRSTLLYLPIEGKQPKTLLVTSAVPNEGKSTLSSNLALIMAFAGKKTLLIDADLRRGALHQSFGVSRDPGLTDVLGHNVNWKLAIRTTGIENLHVMPRGRNVPQPSEYILRPTTDQLLRDLYDLYDYIIIDSSPILAADDTASLAPKIDATLFVVRLSYTSAKMTRKSLEVLYKRGANVPGLILNQVDTKSPEFVYYQYQEYYHTASPGEDNDGSDGPATGSRPRPKPTADVR